eukprot:161535-Rhodomonas_salina.1
MHPAERMRRTTMRCAGQVMRSKARGARERGEAQCALTHTRVLCLPTPLPPPSESEETPEPIR